MKKIAAFVLVGLAAFICLGADGCDDQKAQSASGVSQVSVNVPKGPDGLTAEQRNVRDRLVMDNTPGAIKHLYIISAYSGQVLLYSTVKVKVTSSGKRLTPTAVTSTNKSDGCTGGQSFSLGEGLYGCTNEMIQDDGTYGSSVEYLFWWDVQGRYHQHYPSGGTFIHISDQPIPVKSVVINLESQNN